MTETGRGLIALGYFFGGLPAVSLRMALSRGDAAEARQPGIAHVARTRRLADIGLDVAGAETLPPGPFVLVYNQTSLADDFANSEVMGRLVDRVVLAAEYGWIPFFGRAAARCGIVLLHRGRRGEADRLLDQLAEAAAGGARVAMAPEGRLSPDGKVGHFKRGAFLVAIRARVPVVPMAVHGGRDILPPRSLRMRPGILRYRIGAAIGTEGLTEDDAPILAERAQAAVAALDKAAAC